MAAIPTIHCPHCQASLKLKNSNLVGREVPCPKCQQRFVVTDPSDADESDSDFNAAVAEDERSEKKRRAATPASARSAGVGRKKRPSSKKSGSNVKWIVAGVAFLVCAIGAGIVVSSSLASRGAPTATAAAVSAPNSGSDVKPQAAPPNQTNPPSQADVPAPAQDKLAAKTPEIKEMPPAGLNVAAKLAVQPEEPAPATTAANDASPAAASRPSPEAGAPVIGKVIPEFSASATDNTTFHSKDRQEKVFVVAFMGVECPLANLYYANLVAAAAQFADQPVAFVVVNSNGQDTINAVREQAKTHGAKFPVLKDAGNQVADLFGAVRTPELFILDEQRTVRYHGVIDDQYGYQSRRQVPSQHYATDAIRSLLAGELVAVAETPLQGCHIGRKGKSLGESQTSFYRDVLPILQDRCQQCHRAGDIGPFALHDYAACSNWGETIKEAVTERRMPPWPADPAHGDFTNELRLPDAELATLVKWVDEGCPEGNSADQPAPKEFIDGWNIGTPDREFVMEKPFEVPATGVVDYQHFVISPVFAKDVWVQAVECKYGDRSVVHHMLALLHFPKDEKRSQDGLRNGYFAAGAPGSNYLVFPPGHAKRIPKGAQLVLQMHYTPNGTATKDQSRLGVILAEEPVEYEVQTYAIGTTDILVKAGDPNYKKTYTEPIDNDVIISALMPHLHMRGKSFVMDAITPDGKTQTLISLPRWDFNWQYQYQLAEPIALPKGSKISVTAVWDNSDKNPNNILPPVDVGFGEQTFDEMFIGYVNFIIPKKPATGVKSMGRPRG
jgi:predicted Zn finger-like uncharacterized protein